MMPICGCADAVLDMTADIDRKNDGIRAHDDVLPFFTAPPTRRSRVLSL